MEQEPQYTFDWKLHTVMSDRGIRTATELHRRLQARGITLTSHQVSRIVSNLPVRLNTHVLLALVLELDCGVEDLFRVVEVPAVTKTSAARRKKSSNAPLEAVGPAAPASKRVPQAEVPDEVLGPKVTRLPKRPPKE
jgi:hypothetical protein